MNVSNDDLKELFELLTSSTKYELEKVFDSSSSDYYKNVNLADEYEVTQPKREYALEAWNAVTYFLHRHGYSLAKDGEILRLDFAEDNFLD